MAFCINCGKELMVGARFCDGCGASVNQDIRDNLERKIVYEGEIHKCPQCGEVLDSFVTICPSCGYELRGSSTTGAVKEFARKLNNVTTEYQKANIIRSFPIPNTKEDIFEFMILASSNIDEHPNKQVVDAWIAKFEHAYEKAKLSFGDTPEFEKVKEIYKSKNKQIRKSKNRSKKNWMYIFIPVVAFVPIVLIALTLWGASAMYNSGHNEIEVENARLEAIVDEINDAIEDENYVLARTKAASLVFSVHNGYEKEYVETWNEKRIYILSVIDEAEREEVIDTPSEDNKTETQEST